VIEPASRPTSSDVARHYDELDFFYRDVWGEHVHHGVWTGPSDDASVRTATLRLLFLAVQPLRLLPGQNVADIGCGYGAASRWLADTFGANVTGVTLSSAQAAEAHRHSEPSRGSVCYRVTDWLDNQFPSATFDAAIAIESLAHMTDKQRFFDELHRTLKPGGKAAIACWMAAGDPTRLERKLLEKICDEGRFPGMGAIDEYLGIARRCGLHVAGHRDLSREVERTWRTIGRRLLAAVVTRKEYAATFVNRAFRERLFLLTLPRLMLAYHTGALRYGLIWLERAP
jgi:tocopherol O-methyltransferase